MKTVFRWIRRVLTGAVVLLLLSQLWFFAHVLWWRSFDPSSTRFMRLTEAALKENSPDGKVSIKQVWVPYDEISSNLKRAVVAAEDARFLQHNGFDWEGIRFAAKKNLTKGKVRRGGSTITQQLAKNLFLSPSRSYLRKAQEAVITVMIEATWSKARILEVYLNVAQWGPDVFGAEAASRRYFKHSAARITPAEAARLAIMLPDPRRYSKGYGNAQKSRARRIQSYLFSAKVP